MGLGSLGLRSPEQNDLQLRMLLQMIQGNQAQSVRSTSSPPVSGVGAGIEDIGRVIANAILQKSAADRQEGLDVNQAFSEDRATREDIRANPKAFKQLPKGELGARILPGKNLNAQVQKRFSDALSANPKKTVMEVSKELNISLPQLIGVRAPTAGEVAGPAAAREGALRDLGVQVSDAQSQLLRTEYTRALLESRPGISSQDARGYVAFLFGDEGAQIPPGIPDTLASQAQQLASKTQGDIAAFRDESLSQQEQELSRRNSLDAFNKTITLKREERADKTFDLNKEISEAELGIRGRQLDIQIADLSSTMALSEQQRLLLKENVKEKQQKFAETDFQNSDEMRRLGTMLLTLKGLGTPASDPERIFDDLRLVLNQDISREFGISADELSGTPGAIVKLYRMIFGEPPGRDVGPNLRPGTGPRGGEGIDTTRSTINTQFEYDQLRQTFSPDEIREFFELAPGVNAQ